MTPLPKDRKLGFIKVGQIYLHEGTHILRPGDVSIIDNTTGEWPTGFDDSLRAPTVVLTDEQRIDYHIMFADDRCGFVGGVASVSWKSTGKRVEGTSLSRWWQDGLDITIKVVGSMFPAKVTLTENHEPLQQLYGTVELLIAYEKGEEIPLSYFLKTPSA